MVMSLALIAALGVTAQRQQPETPLPQRQDVVMYAVVPSRLDEFRPQQRAFFDNDKIFGGKNLYQQKQTQPQRLHGEKTSRAYRGIQ